MPAKFWPKHSKYLVHKCSPRQVSDRFELKTKNKSISKPSDVSMNNADMFPAELTVVVAQYKYDNVVPTVRKQ